MEALPLSLALATIFGWCLLSGRLGPAGLTAPIVFVACRLRARRGVRLSISESNPSWSR